ncbi:NXPE family member 3-like isoform X2 [Pyxicephalus adspersus]|uniref:NXPE family member 3-like isoform X2 n=1 Tax=Pyxicephalus adspersus TaxID=30357 RepID=UPI003B5A4456
MWSTTFLRFCLFCCLAALGGFFFRFLSTRSSVKYGPPTPKHHTPSTDAPQTTIMITTNPKFTDLLKLIEWPEPPSPLKDFTFSTDPKICDYHLLNPQDTYKVGETLEVVITARDHNGHVKEWGGDFFQAKLHSPELKAGVTGQVKDYGNGSYLATFLLPWTGLAHVHIRLIHSSEAVDILKKKRESYPEKVYFRGFFHLNGISEEVECNLKMTRKDVCRYKDPVSGDVWECVKPRQLPCDSWVYHAMGGYREVTNKMENLFLSGSVTNQDVPRSFPPIIVTSDNSVLDLTSKLTVCRPGQEPPKPSGFYYKDIWTSLTCWSRHFPSPPDALDCVKGKDIHMFGDSTLRQWFEYLEKFIPSLKRIDLHVNYQSGPLLAVDPNAGLAIRWRGHGLPLRTTKTMISDLHYEVAHLVEIGGGPHTIVLLTLWAHFTTFPVSVYLDRLERVRQAIASLLFRSPETKVIIKSANTGYKSIYGSDWLSLQLDILLRATFKGMGVIIIDAWDMKSCHYLPDNIHPGPPVIQNEVDLVLSYICPK